MELNHSYILSYKLLVNECLPLLLSDWFFRGLPLIWYLAAWRDGRDVTEGTVVAWSRAVVGTRYVLAAQLVFDAFRRGGTQPRGGIWNCWARQPGRAGSIVLIPQRMGGHFIKATSPT